jgi:hypothetical protein
MKRILSLFITLFSVLASFAQSDKSISIASWIDDEKVPIEAQRFLENKLQEIVLSKGYTYNNTVSRSLSQLSQQRTFSVISLPFCFCSANQSSICLSKGLTFSFTACSKSTGIGEVEDLVVPVDVAIRLLV